MSRHEQARATLELYRSGNAYYFRPRVVNKTQ